ncbi:MAG: COX15/CtaA family protein [Pirellulales bacterium]|nr:COX15/CtaA family protein [Pirellulales bacterium]
MPSTAASPQSSWPHRWAWVLACATFPLVWWGGWVVASGSGMAFRDWLTSDGVAMPLYPWLSSAGDKFIEHGHRLLGMVVGALTIVLVVSCHVAPERTAVRRYSLALLVGVIAQGALGGLRVVLDERVVALVHGATAANSGATMSGGARVVALVHGATGPLFFAAAAGMVVLTSSRWQNEPSLTNPGQPDYKLRRLALICAGLAYAQLLLGVVVRHSALMIGDRAPALFEGAAYLHVLVAAAVVVHLALLAVRSRRVEQLRGVTAGLAALVAVQFILGIATWLAKYGWPAWATSLVGERHYLNREAESVRAIIVTGHGAIGALIVALAVVAALLAAKRIGTHVAAACGAAACVGRSFA